MSTEDRLRRFLLYVTLSIFVFSIAELLLLEHTEEPAQWIAFVLCGIGIAAVSAALASRRRGALVALRVVMALIALGGLVGVYLHFDNNFAFEREMAPNAPTGEVLWDAIHGASPLLAPGIMLLAAGLAIAATYRHPALER
jgi:hypothetical protein